MVTTGHWSPVGREVKHNKVRKIPNSLLSQAFGNDGSQFIKREKCPSRQYKERNINTQNKTKKKHNKTMKYFTVSCIS